MSRLHDDYIWVRERSRPRLPIRWLGLLLTVPLVLGVIGLGAQTEDVGQSRNETRSAAAAKQANEAGATFASAENRVVPTTIADVPLSERLAVAAETENVERAANAVATAQTQKPADSKTPEKAKPKTSVDDWQTIEIESGDTLSLAFERHDLSYSDSLRLAHLPEHGRRFTRGLKAGDKLRVRADKSGHVLAVEYPLDELRTLTVTARDDGYAATIEQQDVERRTAYAVGTIESSFYVDALEAGLSDALIMNLAQIFAWDIDFVLDIRRGDRFIVVYEELYRDGEKLRNGEILAAEFQNRDRQLRAFRYEHENGKVAYYNPGGEAMKKAFLRTPLDVFRISSHFSLGRKHPVLNRIRAHKGTDYAAPTGTPIKAAGDGRIVYRGRKGGYGNVVYIKHNGRYSTRYAHLSRFASGLGTGSRVQQGQVIGYVGQSGLATGPHLHYEFRVNGHPRDPERVDLPKAPPLPDSKIAGFRDGISPLLSQLEALDRIQVASNQDGG